MEDNMNNTYDEGVGNYEYNTTGQNIKDMKEKENIELDKDFFTIRGGNPTISDEFKNELRSVLNRYSRENQSNTPDHILCEYLLNCLTAFDSAVNSRTIWYDFKEETKKTEEDK